MNHEDDIKCALCHHTRDDPTFDKDEKMLGPFRLSEKNPNAFVHQTCIEWYLFSLVLVHTPHPTTMGHICPFGQDIFVLLERTYLSFFVLFCLVGQICPVVGHICPVGKFGGRVVVVAVESVALYPTSHIFFPGMDISGYANETSVYLHNYMFYIRLFYSRLFYS